MGAGKIRRRQSKLHWKPFRCSEPKRVSEEEAVKEERPAEGAASLDFCRMKQGDQIEHVEPELVQRTATLLYDNGILKDKPDIQKLTDQSLSKFANELNREQSLQMPKGGKCNERTNWRVNLSRKALSGVAAQALRVGVCASKSCLWSIGERACFAHGGFRKHDGSPNDT